MNSTDGLAFEERRNRVLSRSMQEAPGPEPHYARAPIREAVIDLQVELPEGSSVEPINSVRRQLQSDYPAVTELFVLETQVMGGASVGARASQTPRGFKAATGDGRQVVQLRIDGFTFSRLTPYQRWNPFRDEAQRLWRAYSETVHPISIKRAAVRYINQFELPLPFDDFREFVLTVPEIAPALPQALSNFIMRIEIPQEDIQGMLLLTETLVPLEKEDALGFILDIDLFRDQDVPQEEEALWTLFERLRRRKNEVFEACITNRTRELIS